MFHHCSGSRSDESSELSVLPDRVDGRESDRDTDRLGATPLAADGDAPGLSPSWMARVRRLPGVRGHSGRAYPTHARTARGAARVGEAGLMAMRAQQADDLVAVCDRCGKRITYVLDWVVIERGEPPRASLRTIFSTFR